MTINRRRLLQGSISCLAFGALGSLSGCSTFLSTSNLKPDPMRVLDLPPGFSYTILQKKGAFMSDGYQVPGRSDGMASFPGQNNTLILMRNHELDHRQSDYSPTLSSQTRSKFYDPDGYGAVTRLVVDASSLQVVSSNLVLAGTSRNCAGGTSPWGWVSCEENVDAGHGFAFLCRQHVNKLSEPIRLTSLGRFNREAFAFDSRTSISYMTEDRGDGCFYRFVPEHKNKPFAGGRLQAMMIVDAPAFNTKNNAQRYVDYQVVWVDIDDPVSEEDNCRFQGREKGAALISRGEGLWLHNAELYFSATNGGLYEKGQIFQLTGLDQPENTLRLISEAEDESALEFPDNLAVAPWGDLVIAEDGPWTDFIRMINRQGRVTTLARNARSFKEITGVNFSPDGSILFMNMQHEGLTIAIKGPFKAYSQTAPENREGTWGRALSS